MGHSLVPESGTAGPLRCPRFPVEVGGFGELRPTYKTVILRAGDFFDLFVFSANRTERFLLFNPLTKPSSFDSAL
jgi:hypothetical protein